MNWLHCGAVIVLVILFSGCASKTVNIQLGENPGAEERRLLVTFADRTIDRNLSGNSQDNYRLRGRYGNSGWSERRAHQLAERYRLQFVAQWPVTELGVSCVVYRVPETLPLQEVMAALQRDPDVSLVQLMRSFEVLADELPAATAHNDPYLKLQAGFQALGVSELHQKSTGRGIRIAVIDTGVDIGHPDLKGQIDYFENMVPELGDPDFAEIHGTAVAGVLSARPDNHIGIAGIAPEAEVLAFRACWPIKSGALAARCNSFTLALALNQAIRLDSHIINLSLSGPEDPLLRLLIEKALSKGVVVVAARPGEDQNDGFPASMPGVIPVAQEGKAHQPGIVGAPGQDILTTVPHEGYDFMSGSSFATPHVVGVIALLLQLHPDWQAADLKRQFASEADRLTAHTLNTENSIFQPVPGPKEDDPAFQAVPAKWRQTGRFRKRKADGHGGFSGFFSVY
jgi:subtilisin family serine protease